MQSRGAKGTEIQGRRMREPQNLSGAIPSRSPETGLCVGDGVLAFEYPFPPYSFSLSTSIAHGNTHMHIYTHRDRHGDTTEF